MSMKTGTRAARNLRMAFWFDGQIFLALTAVVIFFGAAATKPL